MKLRHCRNLTTTPDFTEITNLEKLILEGSVNLVNLHPSIGMLKKLVMLNMRDCIKIRSFPCKVEMDSLQVLILTGCLKLDNLSQFSGALKSLVKLYADGTAITGFPSFISSSTNLQVLKIGRYQRTESPTWLTSIFQKQPQSLVLPSLASLQLLTKLSVRNCNISEVCPDIGTLSCLRHLDLSGNDFTKLPGSLSQLFGLEWLQLDGCKKLEVLPQLPPGIEHLFAYGCTSLQEPPRLIHQHPSLYCDFIDCPKMFGNVTIDGQVQTLLMDSSTTSHASTNQLSLLFEYLCIQSTMSEFFSGSGSLNEIKRLEMVFHGNKIPQWFTNQSMGSHVKVELPPYWRFSKFNGFGICVVFTPKESYRRKWNFGLPGFSVNNFDGASIDGVPAFSPLKAKKNTLRIHDKDIIWLYFKTGKQGWNKAKKSVTFSFKVDNVEAIKECGVRLVCDDDEDLQQQEEETLLSIIQHLPPQTQHSGYFGFRDNDDFIKFSW